MAGNLGSVSRLIASQVGRTERVIAARLQPVCEAKLLVTDQKGIWACLLVSWLATEDEFRPVGSGT
jgi:hypothetical protein